LFLEASKAGATSTFIKLAPGVDVTARSIRQILHDSKKFKYMKRKNALMLKQKHIINRLKLAEKKCAYRCGIIFSHAQHGTDGSQIENCYETYVMEPFTG